ncbi:MAG: T9SS type A sorting domain-containing protein [Flavobacteriales bacterium]|nr:T9SS type A sorting domain-containing protein [Flavobacteriales bacterium]
MEIMWGVGTTTSFNTVNDKDYYICKINKNSSQIWQQVPSVLGDEEGFSVLELANNNLFIVGSTEATGGGGKDAKIFLITSNGFWGGQNSSFGGVDDELVKSITFGKDGSIKMAGFTNGYGFGLDDMLIIDVDTVVPNHQFTVDTIFDLPPVMIVDYYKDNIDLLVYPNPTSKSLKFKSSVKISKIKIADIYGRIVKEIEIGFDYEISISEFSNGMYNVLFYSREDLINTQKVIIRK